jgi:prophage endopeptidase
MKLDFNLIPDWAYALLAVLLITLGFGAGWTANGWRKDAQIAEINQGHANAAARAAEENAASLAAANLRGDNIALQLAGWENTLTVFAQEKTHEIERLTVGRRCLDGAAVRVLNQSVSLQQPRLIPEATSEPVRTDVAFATDTDVGSWIVICQRGYQTCSGRLDAIAKFYSGDASASE